MKNFLNRWVPVLLMMSIIFWFSSHPSNELPNFNWADHIVKKSGHAIGFALLAFAYLRALNQSERRYWLAWVGTILYAITDEFHQSFVPGRTPSIFDVMIFDNLGAIIALLLAYLLRHKKSQPS